MGNYNLNFFSLLYFNSIKPLITHNARDDCCRFLVAPQHMMKRQLLTFFSENNFDDTKRREVLEREGVLFTQEWKEKREKKKEPDSKQRREEEHAEHEGGSSIHSKLWRNQRMSISFSLAEIPITEEWLILEKFSSEREMSSSLQKPLLEPSSSTTSEAHNSVYQNDVTSGPEDRPLSQENTTVTPRGNQETLNRLAAKLADLQKVCLHNYGGLFHQMKGDISKATITLGQKHR